MKNKKVLISIIVGAFVLVVVGGFILLNPQNKGINCKHDDPTKIVSVEAIAPTCKKEGVTEGMKCLNCGTMVVPQMTLEKSTCVAGEWIIDVEATHTEDGKKHTVCAMCGELVQQEIILSGNKLLEYTLLDDNTYMVKGIGSCKDTEIIIPSEYNSLPVTSIGDIAFFDCKRLTNVVIGDSVTSIGDYAFASCSSLTRVVIPDSVTSIGDYAFGVCSSLTGVVIPDSVTSIGESAFASCSSLASVVIPDSVTSIGESAFSDCSSLTSVVIPDSVTSISDYAFRGCTSLTSIKYRGTEEQWDAISKGTDWNMGTYNYTIIYNYTGE